MHIVLKASICLLVCIFSKISQANDSLSVRFLFNKKRISDSEVLLTIKAEIPAGIKLYGIKESENDALYSTIDFDSSAKPYVFAKMKELGTFHSEKDSSVNATVHYYSDSVLWQQNINIASADSVSLKGVVSYLYKKGEEYLPGEKEFKINIEPQQTKA